MPKQNAEFSFVPSTVKDAVFIIDLDQGMSVTGDAKAVVAQVLQQHPGKRIIYRDTGGRWDELRHDGRIFTGFAPLSLDDQIRFAQVIDALID